MARRPPSWVFRQLRRDQFERDGGACRLCGRPVHLGGGSNELSATIGHIWPHSMGGATSLDNTRLECAGCNQEHGISPRL